MDWQQENQYNYTDREQPYEEEPYGEEDNEEETPCDRCARMGYVNCSSSCPEMGFKVHECYD